MNRTLDDRINETAEALAEALAEGTAHAGDRESLLVACRQYALRYARTKGPSSRPFFDEEDFAQEICIKVDHAVRRYDPARARFTTLLQTICRNTRSDFLRESARRNAVETHRRVDDIEDEGYDAR